MDLILLMAAVNHTVKKNCRTRVDTSIDLLTCLLTCMCRDNMLYHIVYAHGHRPSLKNKHEKTHSSTRTAHRQPLGHTNTEGFAATPRDEFQSKIFASIFKE